MFVFHLVSPFPCASLVRPPFVGHGYAEIREGARPRPVCSWQNVDGFAEVFVFEKKST